MGGHQSKERVERPAYNSNTLLCSGNSEDYRKARRSFRLEFDIKKGTFELDMWFHSTPTYPPKHYSFQGVSKTQCDLIIRSLDSAEYLRQQKIAFLMGQHRKLGAKSSVYSLPQHILPEIFSYIREEEQLPRVSVAPKKIVFKREGSENEPACNIEIKLQQKTDKKSNEDPVYVSSAFDERLGPGAFDIEMLVHYRLPPGGIVTMYLFDRPRKYVIYKLSFHQYALVDYDDYVKLRAKLLRKEEAAGGAREPAPNEQDERDDEEERANKIQQQLRKKKIHDNALHIEICRCLGTTDVGNFHQVLEYNPEFEPYYDPAYPVAEGEGDNAKEVFNPLIEGEWSRALIILTFRRLPKWGNGGIMFAEQIFFSFSLNIGVEVPPEDRFKLNV